MAFGTKGHLLTLMAVAPLAACRLDVQVILYDDAVGHLPRPEGCELLRIPADDPDVAQCLDIGDVSVSSWSWLAPCDTERIEEEIWKQACRAGASAVVIRRIPDQVVGCDHARARLLACRELAAAGGHE